MGGLVEKQLTRAIEALGGDEDARADRRRRRRRAAINQLQINIDQQCAQIIARRQPAAIDLRMVLTVTKIVNDLERIGDEVKKIAYKAAQTRGSDRLARVRYYDVGARPRRALRDAAASRSTRSRASTSSARRRSSPRTRRSTRRSRRSCAS